MRICFVDAADRNSFFQEVRKSTNLSWSTLAFDLGTNRKVLEFYRKGTRTIPENVFFQLYYQLKSENQETIIQKIIVMPENWGRVKGGHAAYKLNKDLWNQNKNRNRTYSVKYEFDINLPLTQDLCEFIGGFIGDGSAGKYQNHYQIQFAGDATLDREYFNSILIPFCIENFGINPRIRIVGNSLSITMNSKRLHEMLTQRFGFPSGKKCHTVRIPDEIMSSTEDNVSATLKGMFNTDGGVGFDKRKTYKKPYIRVHYTSASKELIAQVHAILTRYDIKHSIHTKDNAQMIQINGFDNVSLFIRRIGFSNPRHMKKLNIDTRQQHIALNVF